MPLPPCVYTRATPQTNVALQFWLETPSVASNLLKKRDFPFLATRMDALGLAFPWPFLLLSVFPHVSLLRRRDGGAGLYAVALFGQDLLQGREQ